LVEKPPVHLFQLPTDGSLRLRTLCEERLKISDLQFPTRMSNQITIHIYPADQEEEGYMFDVYLDKSPDDIASAGPYPHPTRKAHPRIYRDPSALQN